MSDSKVAELRRRLGEVADLSAAVHVLAWDQETYMPPKAAPSRGQQLATLSAVAHRAATSPELGSLLADLQDQADALVPDDAKLVEVAAYDYGRATKLPATFVQRFAEEQSKAYNVWVKARQESDFALFKRNLAILLDLLKEKADLLGYEDSPYDALLEEFERGMTAAQLKVTFGELAPKQSALVERILGASQPDLLWLDQEWDEEVQWEFTLEVLRDMGYDFEAGRQDRSVHPFTTSFDLSDVRVTTRLNAKELFSALTGSIHEGGHALYSQGHDPRDRRTPLLDGPSLGIHESQSRLWENMIGRSLPFWQHYAQRLREYFPGKLNGVSSGDIYRAINKVAPSLIRVEADECTYNLHIILRFEIEVALMAGDLGVDEIPEAWNAKMKEYVGLDVPDDARGCLQDIHWSHGAMGYFPTYALGNLYAAQLFEAILADIPGLFEQVASGQFGPLLAWLREHVHRHGRRKLAAEIVRDATGREPDSEAFLRYLEAKYSRLYDL
jgi:carboxypeptidase Taq